MGQFVLACVGFAAILILFVHPLFNPPASTPVKAQLVSAVIAIVTAWLVLSLELIRVICRPLEIEKAFTPPEDERLALICTLIC